MDETRTIQDPQTRPDDAPKTRAEQTEFDDLWRPTEDQAGPQGPVRLLLDRGLITPHHLAQAVERQKQSPRSTLLELLVQAKSIDEMHALGATAKYFKIPLMRVAAADVDAKIFDLLPVDYLKNKKVLPIRKLQDGLVVGISNPADIFLIDDLQHRLNSRIKLVLTPPKDILAVIEELSASTAEQVDEIIKDISEDTVEVVEDKTEEVTDLEKIAGESPVIRYVNYLISSAYRDGASDIHIEPGENTLRIRCRVDGVLFDQPTPPAKMRAAIISRLKIMANMNIAERRLPQDGRIRAALHGNMVDLRVSTLPVTQGEKCVIRILDNRAIRVGLDNLGMLPDTLESFRNYILQPHGIVLVTGPTGSGKSTTLYSALRVMDGGKLNISTVEDPVEYELDFANQVNVHDSIGMTFSAALRSLLRQDPDVIMLGEIRDEETARIAIQASLTGHMVLSTLHTNDAPSSITRMINIGIEPYLISAAVNAVLAQRLVRRICENCKRPVTELPGPARAYLDSCGVQPDQVHQGAGCDRCRQTGYKGRVGVYELLEITDELRDAISRNLSLGDFRRAARESGMRRLRDDGLVKIESGLTTVEEIMRITET